MRTFTRLSAMVAASVLVLAGCGGGKGTAAPGGELVFANFQWLEANRGDQIWQAVTAYQAVNPTAKLRRQAIVRGEYETTLQDQMAAHGGPDILIIPDTFLGTLAAGGMLEPLDNVLDEAQKKTLNATNEGGKYEGKQFAYGWEAVSYALFWNKALLEQAGAQPPTDLPSLVTAAKAIKQKTGVPGFAVRHLIKEETPWWIDFSNWPYGYGGGWSKGGKLTIDSPENIAAVTAYKQMYDSGAMAVGDDASTFRAKFTQGKLGMMIDNSSALFTMVDGNTLVPSTNVGAARLPFPTPRSSQAKFYIGINRYANNKDLAKAWLKWFYTEKAQTGAAAALGASVIGTDAKPPASFVTANPWVPVFQERAPDASSAVVVGFESKTPQIRHAVLTEIGKVLVGGEDPATALKQAQQEAEKVAGS